MTKTKILVAEDEAITAKDMQKMLNELGYDVPAIASSGEEAIKNAEEMKPDLILMDIILKGMDGIEAAGKIHDRFGIPVIYFTAFMDEERLKRTKDTEPFGYINKKKFLHLDYPCGKTTGYYAKVMLLRSTGNFLYTLQGHPVASHREFSS